MTSPIQVGKAVPAFSAPSTSGGIITLAELKGKNVVLYFYPKDNTAGCTQQGIDFNARLPKFTKANALILGVSRDTIKCHDGFRTKQGYRFELLSDIDETLCNLFEVIKMKNMYGKKVRGIERSTFLIDTQGVLRQAWRKVKVEGHAEEVLTAVQALS